MGACGALVRVGGLPGACLGSNVPMAFLSCPVVMGSGLSWSGPVYLVDTSRHGLDTRGRHALSLVMSEHADTEQGSTT